MNAADLIVPGKANVIIDGQWGSTGKGKLAGWLATNHKIDYAVCDYMPNAGHTYVDDDGEKFILKQFPVSGLFGIPVYIGPHAAINLEVFLKEVEMIQKRAGHMVSISVHPLATMVIGNDISFEREWLKRIASTAQGGHSSSSRKMLRMQDACLAEDCPEMTPYIEPYFHDVLQRRHKKGQTGLIETAQGFDLGLNHGYSYPYVSGRDCLVGRVLDNAGLPVSSVGSIIASLRTYPIRVGSTPDGSSGPYYSDHREISWEELSRTCGVPGLVEKTTVTKRIRRVFTFSETQIERFCSYVAPTHAFLNFVNYYEQKEGNEKIEEIRRLLGRNGCKLSLLGTGPKNSEMVLM